MSSQAAPPTILPLAEPRALSIDERELLDRLLESPQATEELRQQARAAKVNGTCSCGCPSITLMVPDDAPLARWETDIEGVRYGDDLSINADATSPDGRDLHVALHVAGGRLYELEIWAGTWGGEPKTALPHAGTVRFWR